MGETVQTGSKWLGVVESTIEGLDANQRPIFVAEMLKQLIDELEVRGQISGATTQKARLQSVLDVLRQRLKKVCQIDESNL